jgi:hypothetical protein
MNDIEWMMHEINVQIDEATHRIEVEIVHSKNNPETHYHATKTWSCTRTACGGYSPIWLLRNTLVEALQQLNKKYPFTVLNEVE